MHGDRIAVRITRYGRDGRAEGDIVRIVERTHATVVGKVHLRRRGVYIEPHDDRVQHWIHIPEALALPKGGSVHRVGAKALEITRIEELEGLIVNVEITEFPKQSETALGRIVEILGHPNDFGIDVEITIRKFHLPNVFPPEVLEQARSISRELSPDEISKRTDFRDREIVTIDGESARDFDDAVRVEHLPNGHYALEVHIADVSHYVRPGTFIDKEAALRGTSVYFPDRAVPMLPIELSTDICSLRPNEDRLVLSALLEIDHQGEIVSQRFCRGIIRSAARMTYTAVNAALEGEPEAVKQYAQLVPHFQLMRDLALILQRKRERRGSIDFDLPEAQIEFNENGEMVSVSRAARNIAHRLIEEFMLAANEAVDTHVSQFDVPMVHRIHEMPDAAKVVAFEEVAAQFGVSLGIGALKVKKFAMNTRHRDGRKTRREVEVPAEIHITSRHYQKLIARLQGKPEERVLQYLMLRSLKQARYSANGVGHFALAAEFYTHFTSPIRRYPDLLVHRILGAIFDHAQPPYSEGVLAKLADRASETERTAAEAERELMEWKKLKFLADKVGDEFSGLIISTTKFGFFVELSEYFIEGIVPIERIFGDRYEFQENTRRIVGRRTRREFKIGDRLTVRLDRINATSRRAEFSPIIEATPRNHRNKDRNKGKRK